MTLYDVLLFLHVASAFAFVASYVVFAVVLLAGRGVERPGTAAALLGIVRPANVAAWIGATGTLVFGVWLAIEVDAYELWDAWILGAFALWLVAEEAIRRVDLVLRSAQRAVRALRSGGSAQPEELRAVLSARESVLLHLLGSGAMLGVLALMIFKPGAV